jgi:hypothetical protein
LFIPATIFLFKFKYPLTLKDVRIYLKENHMLRGVRSFLAQLLNDDIEVWFPNYSMLSPVSCEVALVNCYEIHKCEYSGRVSWWRASFRSLPASLPPSPSTTSCSSSSGIPFDQRTRVNKDDNIFALKFAPHDMAPKGADALPPSSAAKAG